MFNITSTALTVVNFVEFVALFVVVVIVDLNQVKHKKFFFFVVVVVADAA